MENETEEIREVEKTLDLATTLAIERTRVAYERTMLAWIRTAASLITFGFSVDKFFELANPRGNGHPIGSRAFGTILVCIGLVSLLVSTIEYRQGIGRLNARMHHQQRSTSVIVAGMIGILGIVALIMINVRR